MARLIYRRPEQLSFILYYTALTGLSVFDLQWPCSCPRVCRCLPVWSLTSLRGGYRIHSHRAPQDCGCTSLVKQEEHLSRQKTSGLIKKTLCLSSFPAVAVSGAQQKIRHNCRHKLAITVSLVNDMKWTKPLFFSITSCYSLRRARSIRKCRSCSIVGKNKQTKKESGHASYFGWV